MKLKPKFEIALLGAGSLLVVGCLLSGCAVHYHDHDDHPQRVVHVKRSHVCGPGCHDHYWDGSRVLVIRGHRHGPGCGHDWDGRYWITVRKTPVHVHQEPPHRVIHEPPVRVSKVKHVHSERCGCVYHPHHRTWIIVESKGHVHGPGCGHFYIEGRWSIGR